MEVGEGLRHFIAGATMLANVVIGLYFLRFWRETKDRLFAIFSLAFFVFAANRVLLSFLDEQNEARTFVYVIRLIAFLLIIAGIVDKNRPSKPPRPARDN